MSDIYKIAVALTMTSNAPALLATLSKHLLGVHADVKKLEGGLNRLHVALGGSFAIASGAAMIGMLKDVTGHARELSHELATLRTFNIPQDQINRISQAARATTDKVPGSTESGNLAIAGAAYSMFGVNGTLKIMQPLARFAQVSAGISGNYESANDGLYAMLRSGDLMGKLVDEKTHQVSTDKLLGFLDTALKIETATHGRVNANTFLALGQQGGPALANMSDEGLMTMAMVAQGMGGFRAGTAMTSLYQQFVGGTMTEPRAKELHRLGLIGDYEVGRGGHLVFGNSALNTPFAQAMSSDPGRAAALLQQSLSAHGFTDIESQTKELFLILGRQTTQRIVSDLIRNLPQMMAERGRMEGAQGLDAQAQTRNAEDYIAVEHNLQSAWENLMQAVAGPNASAAIGVMHAMTDSLNWMTDGVRKIDPQTLQNIGIGIGVLGGALIGGGAIALAAALGPVGWFGAGIIALGAAVAIWKPEWLTKIGAELSGFFSQITSFNWLTALGQAWNDAIRDIGNIINAAFAALPHGVQDAINGAVSGIANLFKDAIAKFLGLKGDGKSGDPTTDEFNKLFTPGSYRGGDYGSLLHNASWGGGIGPTSTGWSMGGASSSERAAFIMSTAKSLGIDPKTALRVAQSEGFYGFTGDGGMSHGDFQLYDGGGLGNVFRKQTGLNPADPKNWAAADLFAMEWAAKHGWGDFHGAARVGIDRWQGIHNMEQARGAAVPPRHDKPTVIHVPVHLDGKVIAKVVTKRQVQMAEFPQGVHGMPDDFGSFLGPGSTMQPT